MTDFNFRVMGLDPGKTTGWDTYSALLIPSPIEDGGVEILNETWAGGYLPPDKHHLRLEQLIGLQNVEEFHVVCERFDQRPGKMSTETISKEYQGVVERTCQELKVPLHLQMPAQAKGFVKDENLKKASLWIPGHQNRHQRDARRHILFWLISQKKRNDLLAKGWK
jgi:hypothetical protein